MRQIVIGLGETGGPLQEILGCAGYDSKHGGESIGVLGDQDILHICIPYSDIFVELVKQYQRILKASLTVIHSTVPIGTTAMIPDAVHSPIRGRHNRMKEDLYAYVKWIGGERAREAAELLKERGFRVRVVPTSEQTEAMKLLCLAKYGVSLAFAHYCKELADKYHFEYGYNDIYSWDSEYNAGVGEELKRPLIALKDDKIGGHCVTQNTKILNDQHPNQMLDEVLKYV